MAFRFMAVVISCCSLAKRRRVMHGNRLPDLLHYVIAICDPGCLDAAKLNDICWFSDVEAFRQIGRSISGANHYIRLQRGPALKNVQFILRDLQQTGRIAISEHDHYDVPNKTFISRQRPNLSAFSAAEIAIIDRMSGLICSKHPATSFSLISHDALWEEIDLGNDIPIAAASVIPGDITADDLKWARQTVVELDADSSTA